MMVTPQLTKIRRQPDKGLKSFEPNRSPHQTKRAISRKPSTRWTYVTKHSLSPGSSLVTTEGNPIVDLRDQLNARVGDLRAKLDHKKDGSPKESEDLRALLTRKRSKLETTPLSETNDDSEMTNQDQLLPDWRTEFIQYLTTGTLPTDKWAARRLKRRSAHYVVMEEELHRVTANKPLNSKAAHEHSSHLVDDILIRYRTKGKTEFRVTDARGIDRLTSEISGSYCKSKNNELADQISLGYRGASRYLFLGNSLQVLALFFLCYLVTDKANGNDLTRNELRFEAKQTFDKSL
ncbi:hypothetical protein YC2023_089698 [Brassica napus]